MDKQSHSPKQVLEQQPRRNYGAQYQSGGHQIKCYTKKQMKSLYPGQDYKVVAEHAPGSKKQPIGVLESGKRRPVYRYKSHSRLAYREYGFAAVGEDSYVALLKSALLPRAAILLACLAIIAGGVFFALTMDKSRQVANMPEESVAAGGPELDEGAADWEGNQDTAESDVPDEGIRIPGFKSMTVEAKKTEVTVNLNNPEENNCLFVIRIVLTDTGETLYESKMIEPGKGLYEIPLSRALEPGTYQAQLQYEPYNMEGTIRLNGAVMNFELIAE
jgi:hypothetical protein